MEVECESKELLLYLHCALVYENVSVAGVFEARSSVNAKAATNTTTNVIELPSLPLTRPASHSFYHTFNK